MHGMHAHAGYERRLHARRASAQAGTMCKDQTCSAQSNEQHSARSAQSNVRVLEGSRSFGEHPRRIPERFGIRSRRFENLPPAAEKEVREDSRTLREEF